MERMDREQFFAVVGRLSQDELQKALWTLYWRGSAAMRERVIAAITPQAILVKSRPADTIDPREVLAQVRQFVELARAGAYIAGGRRGRPQERTQWRFTFKRLVTQAREALRAPDIAAGATALETLIDLANETRGYQYFRSEDAV